MGNSCQSEVLRRWLAVVMLRQKRRRIKRQWDKVKCFVPVCTSRLGFVEIHNAAIDFAVKVSEDVVFRFVLSMFQRWHLFPCIVVDGFIFSNGLSHNIGRASDDWLDSHFGKDEFEGLHHLGFRLCQ